MRREKEPRSRQGLRMEGTVLTRADHSVMARDRIECPIMIWMYLLINSIPTLMWVSEMRKTMMERENRSKCCVRRDNKRQP